MATALEHARARSVKSLLSPDGLAETLTSLAQLMADAVAAGDQKDGAGAAQVLFDMSCSGSGTRVTVEEATGSGASCAVLILGYAGSAVNILSSQVRFYQKLLGCKVVATVASGLCDDPLAGKSLERQCDQVCTALAGSRKILVHCMSNNGQGLFAVLLHSKLVLRSRIAAVVYDCAAARVKPAGEGLEQGIFSNGEQIAHVVKSTVLMPLITNRVTVQAPDGSTSLTVDGEGGLRAIVDTASRWLGSAMAERAKAGGSANHYFWANRQSLDGLGCHDYDATHCPHVPVLCLTSPDDKVITPDAVADWVVFLKRTSGGRRDVRLETAPTGSHCMLLQRHEGFYAETIGALVEAAGITDADAPIKVARDEDAVGASPLAAALEPAGLAHLAAQLGTLSLDECCALYEEGGRTRLLARLKEAGVLSLSERQKAAGAIAKASKERGAAPVAVT